MNKITEITYVGEGMQVKQKLKETYTYDELSEKCMLYEESLKRYLAGKEIKVEKFIKHLEELFQKPYDKIVKLVDHQLAEYIIEIKNNIKYYNTPADNKVINQQYEEAKKFCKPYNKIVAQGNLALYRYNMGLFFDAIELLEETIKNATKENIKELIIYYSVQLAFVHLSVDLGKSRNILSRIEKYIDEDIPKETLFNYYHFYGVCLKRWGDHKEAREVFHKTLNYTTNDSQTARVLSNIGQTYYEEKKYKNALVWSRRALDKGLKYPEIGAATLNNIALIYYKKGEISRAKWFIEKAMENFSEDLNASLRVLIYDTYLELGCMDGDKLLDLIINIFGKRKILTEFQEYLPMCVERLAEYLRQNEDFDNLHRLMVNIMVDSEKAYKGFSSSFTHKRLQ